MTLEQPVQSIDATNQTAKAANYEASVKAFFDGCDPPPSLKMREDSMTGDQRWLIIPPSPYDPIQSGIGDCFFVSALSSLATTKSGKQKIHDMINLNEDGSYTVVFPGAKDSPVKVTDDDITEAGVNNISKWANVVETAFLKHNQDGMPWSNLLQKEGISIFAPVRTARDAARLLTGDDVMTDQFAVTDIGSGQLTLGQTSKENVRKDIMQAFGDGAVIVAGANASFTKFLGGNDAGPLVDGHAYAVLGFDPSTNTIKVRNPWASMTGTPLEEKGVTVDGITHRHYGVMEMSLDTFYEHFSDITISGRNETVGNLEHAVNDMTDAGGHIVNGVNSLLTGKPIEALQNFTEISTDRDNLLHDAAYGGTNLARVLVSTDNLPVAVISFGASVKPQDLIAPVMVPTH